MTAEFVLRSEPSCRCSLFPVGLSSSPPSCSLSALRVSSDCLFVCLFIFYPVKSFVVTGHVGWRESRGWWEFLVLRVPGSGTLLQPRAARAQVPQEAPGVLRSDGCREMFPHVQRKKLVVYGCVFVFTPLNVSVWPRVCPLTASVQRVNISCLWWSWSIDRSETPAVFWEDFPFSFLEFWMEEWSECRSEQWSVYWSEQWSVCWLIAVLITFRWTGWGSLLSVSTSFFLNLFKLNSLWWCCWQLCSLIGCCVLM